MPYLRLALCALSAFLVGCASSGSHASDPFEASKYDFPANTVVRTETVYAEPVYAPAVVSTSQRTYVSTSAVKAYEPPAVTTTVYGRVAENGSYYGQPNVNGVPKTDGVSGYYRKDGTYVRGHYRSSPGSNPPSTRRRK
jgi:hypothetical protein